MGWADPALLGPLKQGFLLGSSGGDRLSVVVVAMINTQLKPFLVDQYKKGIRHISMAQSIQDLTLPLMVCHHHSGISV